MFPDLGGGGTAGTIDLNSIINSLVPNLQGLFPSPNQSATATPQGQTATVSSPSQATDPNAAMQQWVQLSQLMTNPMYGVAPTQSGNNPFFTRQTPPQPQAFSGVAQQQRAQPMVPAMQQGRQV